MRFDPHEPAQATEPEVARGVQYVASADATTPPTSLVPWSALATCLAEVFQDTRVIDPADADRWVVMWSPRRRLRLLDLTSDWLVRAGGNQAISSGPRAPAQQWARWIYDTYEELDGVVAAASTRGRGRSIALWDRAATAVGDHPLLHRPLSSPGPRPILAHHADKLGYILV
ncbi:MAG: RES domain-containing protein [Actinobacteria bacterium]|nr:RES domain-containing protein [Actinomycetota bacterium]